jgi:glycosyltransferase involved in cell wall biosynthesis
VQSARRLLVVSEDLGRVATQSYGAQSDRIRVIPNGCDASIFHTGDRNAARDALGLKQDADVVLYVGRLVAEKGLFELLDACRTLSATRPNLQLVLVGEGPLQDELSARIAADASLQVRLAGAQPPADVARWMAASNLVTLPSYSEGHPNVLVEALACGRPVVATAVGGIPEVVDASSGVLVPVRDVPALASGLAQVLERDWDEAALARKFSRDWRKVAEDTLAACEDALTLARTHAPALAH